MPGMVKQNGINSVFQFIVTKEMKEQTMSLEQEVQTARSQIVKDGYDMSVGELMSLYKNHELIINPEFQRYFRWDLSQKTKFIESLLLRIPVPAIFVSQLETGKWELVDGLQRLATIFEFTGLLRKFDNEAECYPPFILAGTRRLPHLAEKRWEDSAEDASDGLPQSLQFDIRRARMRVEIIQRESDPYTKFELFQRLNRGGSPLSEQEVRNCIMVMTNRDFYQWVVNLSELPEFKDTIALTENAVKKQQRLELVVRFLVYRHIPYPLGKDVHDYLDEGIVRLANDDVNTFSLEEEERVFKQTFLLLHQVAGQDVFKRWEGERFTGKFLVSVYEVITFGVSKNLAAITKLNDRDQLSFVKGKVQALGKNATYQQYSGAGKSGSSRLTKLLPMAEDWFRP
jgi:hypothetical protein